jgi:SAM-dependent MidA family methyltransferase
VPDGIAEAIAAEGGRVPFARYMDLALTHSTDGYYRGGEDVLGPHGHFTTAPCVSPEFNGAVERILRDLVDAAVSPQGGGAETVTLVELGGGRGDLAKAVLRGWDRYRPDLRERVTYVVVEVNGPLRDKQRRALTGVMARGWRVEWVGSAGEALEVSPGTSVLGLGNEFIDALPVHLIDVRGDEPLEAWVELHRTGEAGASRLCAREVWGATTPEALAELRQLFGTAGATELRALTSDGIIEVRPAAARLLEQLAAAARACCLLTVDYGGWFGGPVCGVAPAPPYRRTVRGYFRHQLETDPYARIGRQDLTADVDFRALDLHGRRAGFETVLYTTVADLLKAGGGEDTLRVLRERAATSLQSDRRASMLEKLLDGEDLGGAFKVMLQARE